MAENTIKLNMIEKDQQEGIPVLISIDVINIGN